MKINNLSAFIRANLTLTTLSIIFFLIRFVALAG